MKMYQFKQKRNANFKRFLLANFRATVNHTGRLEGLNLSIAWGGGAYTTPLPLKKALENRYRIKMHNHRPIFQRQLIVALVTNKLRAILDFFYTDRTFYRPVPYPMH